MPITYQKHFALTLWRELLKSGKIGLSCWTYLIAFSMPWGVKLPSQFRGTDWVDLNFLATENASIRTDWLICSFASKMWIVLGIYRLSQTQFLELSSWVYLNDEIWLGDSAANFQANTSQDCHSAGGLVIVRSPITQLVWTQFPAGAHTPTKSDFSSDRRC